ncbi:hypothetical protein M438DRAFT_409650 [Aureobasidium pullulans EXF-150]|uniref:DUF676 domain-containing protein n=1 Tax=Aureobasidium pullulans EXF-150 TaxID=1043002 RepID=A0A074X1L1_AURPU|nr:uncharacterized protein M438DRAFT_409650 [Aureobasidium pullulans EXF-150]KEQ79355.1 hypothetical protein M438DRAFT_409650 [Aureobasidium pullulans EXF-150]
MISGLKSRSSATRRQAGQYNDAYAGSSSTSQLQQIDAQVVSGSSAKASLGIKVLSDHPDAEVDICLVHGLTGNSHSTWTHDNGHFWPQDSLPERFPKARIVTYGYDADVVSIWRSTSTSRLREHGETFILALANERSKSLHRPIFFLVHSLGGLVVEQALLICVESNESRYKSISSSAAGIMYFSTPHEGSYLAKWGSIIVGLLRSLGRNVNQDIVSTLEKKSEVLQNVETGFQSHLQHTWKQVKICCFYEQLPIRGFTHVVTKDSAVLRAYTSAGLHGDHITMTKFENSLDPDFALAAGQLSEWITSLDPQTRPESVQSPSSDAANDSSARGGTTTYGTATGINFGTNAAFNGGNISYNAK